ncbi:MAG: STAS domain-containing protein [Candidatus Thiodiazotropha sp. (ex Semelilucina semeliformis)]|nr:STAS domain-containing protein [Candidatus Thiodiazotropha sp. (ex Myrtea spinifera)]MCU7806863.1 STAS domain-containing protein [Candidatus Thiodiazotropha sp. (ex Semelilucina semeliformis)]MCU7809672.1 STAS domain-containing protein [Candidatus Thiodiazotropha sp. (ex Notomyrtea botanica)]MCU7828941.1 STAS domain-containing protein [Candidatus Thiodiazotropha sp. (ex Myrtea sp. 'scaly one' KF741663)]
MATAIIERDGAFHFHVKGEMTFATAKQLLKQSEDFFFQSQDIEIDLSQVTGADSAGLALLLEWKARATQQGVQIVINEIPEGVMSIAHLCQIEPLLQDLTSKN